MLSKIMHKKNPNDFSRTIGIKPIFTVSKTVALSLSYFLIITITYLI